MVTERRKVPRFTVDQIVEVSFGRETFVRGSGINISKNGILCETDGYLEPSAQVALLLTIQVGAEPYRFSCDGVVVRSDETPKGFQSGISFTSLEDADSRKLDAFLKQQKSGSKSK